MAFENEQEGPANLSMKMAISLKDGRPCYFSVDDVVARDPYQQAIANSSVFDSTWQFFYQWIRAGDVFFDVGANVGVFSLPAALKGSQTYAFELLSENVAHLVEAADWNGVKENLKVNQIAIGDSEGQVSFGGFSAWGQVLSYQNHLGSKIAPATTLDIFICEKSVARVDVLKIDIEGSELRALKGADTLLRRDLPDIIIEANALTCGSNDYSYRELLRILSSYGYKIYRIFNGRLCPWDIAFCQEVVCTDYLLTSKLEQELVARTSWTVSPITAAEQAESVIRQGLYNPEHKRYVLAIADTLPQEILKDYKVREVLEEWSPLKDQDKTQFAILSRGAA
jgi:FkbM family methyltransferase